MVHVLVLFDEFNLHDLEPIGSLVHFLIRNLLFFFNPRFFLEEFLLQGLVFFEVAVLELSHFQIIRVKLGIKILNIWPKCSQTVFELYRFFIKLFQCSILVVCFGLFRLLALICIRIVILTSLFMGFYLIDEVIKFRVQQMHLWNFLDRLGGFISLVCKISDVRLICLLLILFTCHFYGFFKI